MTKLSGNAALLAAISSAASITTAISTGVVVQRALTNAEILERLSTYPEVQRALLGAFGSSNEFRTEDGEIDKERILVTMIPLVVQGYAEAISMSIVDDEIVPAALIKRLPNVDFLKLRKGLEAIQAPEGLQAFFDQFVMWLALEGLEMLAGMMGQPDQQEAA